MGGKIPKIGILSLQGAVNEHYHSLQKLNCTPICVNKKKQLKNLKGLIIPGGESTTIGKLMVEYKFMDLIKERVNQGMAVFGTCAGLVLLSKNIPGINQPLLNLMNITVARNSFGRQVNSFETDLEIPEMGKETFPAVFIRAPEILETGKNVKILATLNNKKVMAQQDKLLVSSFHPELTDDLRIHKYFLNTIESK